MPIQVNARLDDEVWERLVEAMPGMSNAERVTQLVNNHMALLASREHLPEALRLMERMLEPALHGLREQNLQGRGSELAESLAQMVAELAALLLSHAARLNASPAQALPHLEALLVQRWAQTTLHLLRTGALAPDRVRHPQAVKPEIQRVFEEARLLSSTLSAANEAASHPPAPSSPSPSVKPSNPLKPHGKPSA